MVGDTSGPILGSNLTSLLENARKHKKEMGDAFVSVEHLVLAFLSDNRFGVRLFRNLKLSEKELKDAVQAVRGSQRVTDQSNLSCSYGMHLFYPKTRISMGKLMRHIRDLESVNTLFVPFYQFLREFQLLREDAFNALNSNGKYRLSTIPPFIPAFKSIHNTWRGTFLQIRKFYGFPFRRGHAFWYVSTLKLKR